MPHHQQFKKALRQLDKLRQRNKTAKSRVATYTKKVRTAGSREEAEQALRQAVSVLDSVARKGIIKKSTAARRKSRLSKFVQTLS